MGASEAIKKNIPLRAPSSSASIICEEKVLHKQDGQEEIYRDFEYLVVLPQGDTPKDILLNLVRSTQNRDDQLLELDNSEEVDGKIYARLAVRPQHFSVLQKNILRNISPLALSDYLKYLSREQNAPSRENIDPTFFSSLHKLVNAELNVYRSVPGSIIVCDHVSTNSL